MKTTTANAAPAKLASLAPAIAAALSGYVSASVGYAAQWTARPVWSDQPDGNHLLTRADGLALYLSGPGWRSKGRITISLSRPEGKNRALPTLYPATGTGQIADPEISVAETKAPDAIAADIARRLLPEAERVHGLALAKIAETDGHESRKLAFLRSVSVAAGLPDVPRDHYSNEPRYALSVRHPDAKPTGYDPRDLAEVEVRGDYAQIKIDASPARALALIAFLRSPAYVALAE